MAMPDELHELLWITLAACLSRRAVLDGHGAGRARRRMIGFGLLLRLALSQAPFRLRPVD
jgi:hypothetical protein